MNKSKINGLILHLESKNPLKVSIEAGKQVFTLDALTLEGLFLELKSLNLDHVTYLKLKIKLEYLFLN